MARKKEEVEDYVWDIFIKMSSKDWMAYVSDNMDELIDEGVYENFLLKAYTGCTLNYHNWDLHELQWMFEMAEKDKLFQAGDPLPGPSPFTIYRGVAESVLNEKLEAFRGQRILKKLFGLPEDWNVYCTIQWSTKLLSNKNKF